MARPSLLVVATVGIAIAVVVAPAFGAIQGPGQPILRTCGAYSLPSGSCVPIPEPGNSGATCAAAGRNLLVGLEVPLPDADELTNGYRCRQPISLARRAPSAMHHGYGSNPVPRAAWLACSDRDRHRMDPHGRGPLGQRLHQEMPSRLLGSGRSALGRSWLVRRRTAVNETGPFGYGMSRLTPPSVIACSGRL